MTAFSNMMELDRQRENLEEDIDFVWSQIEACGGLDYEFQDHSHVQNLFRRLDTLEEALEMVESEIQINFNQHQYEQESA